MYSHIANMKYNKSLELMMSRKRKPGMSKEKVAAVGEMKGELDLTPPEIINCRLFVAQKLPQVP